MLRKTLDGRIAVVTGASRGLGRAIAVALAREGAQVALVSRSRDALASAEAEIIAAKGRSAVFVADVTREDHILRLRDEVVDRLGPVHILINNAGVALRKNITDIALDEWNTVQTSNLTSAFLMSRAFIPFMKEARFGRIISVASVMAHISWPQRAAYSSSKSGMLGLTRAMAVELASLGITANTISPGVFETEMTEPLTKNPEVFAGLISRIPAGRVGKPDEIGALAVYLCGEMAGYITGTDIIIDGGWCAG